MSKKTLKLLLRIGVSILFLAFLFHNSDAVATIESLAKANHLVWLLGIVLYLLGQAISAYKWQLLASTAGFQKKLREYLDYYFIGMFFNLFLPTTVGGDITKCYYLLKGTENQRKAPAVYSVLAERYTGVVIIAFMATIMMFLPIGNKIPLAVKLLMLALSVAIAIITPTFPLLLSPFIKKKKWVRTLLKDIKVYWNSPKLIACTLAWSLIFHILVIGIHIAIGKAMGFNIPLAYYLIVYPMSAMAGFIPLTFNGLGPREGTYIYFLTLAGIKPSAAFAFSLFWFGIVLCSSLIGGIFYIKGRYVPPPEEFDLDIEQESEEEYTEEPIGLKNEEVEAAST